MAFWKGILNAVARLSSTASEVIPEGFKVALLGIPLAGVFL